MNLTITPQPTPRLSEEDLRLARACADGDSEVFAAIYPKHGERMKSIAYNQLGNRSDGRSPSISCEGSYTEGMRMTEPVPDDWDWLDGVAGTFDEDVLDAALEQPVSIERPELDQLFG